MYQAVISISIKGMETQASILLRCLLESLFTLVASSKSEEVVKQFITADQVERRTLFNKAHMWKSDTLIKRKQNEETLDHVKTKPLTRLSVTLRSTL